MLKKIFTLFLFSSFLLIALNCSSKKQEQEEYTPIYSSADTIQVMNLITSYLDNLQAKEYDTAVNGLKVLLGTHVIDLTQVQKDELIAYYKQMPVLSYSLMDKTWNDRDLVTFIYNIEFFEKPEGENIPNTYKITLVPVRINDKWYLTLGGRNFNN